MSKKGLPGNIRMRHDWHYVEEISRSQRAIGKMLPIKQLKPNPDQPRSDFGDLDDLTASILEKGVLEPLLVKPLRETGEWLIIAGERRWRAATAAGLSEVPCIELEIDDREIAEIALIENLQRKDLNVWEEADGLAALCQRFEYMHETVAQRIGKSRTTVTEALTIANLPANVRARCVELNLKTKSVLLQIARQFDEAAMLEQLDLIGAAQQNPRNADSSAPHAGTAENQRANLADAESDRTKRLESNEQTNQSASSERHNPNARQTFNTNLNHPVKMYQYQPEHGDFKLAMKFKKPVDKQEIINTLMRLIDELKG